MPASIVGFFALVFAAAGVAAPACNQQSCFDAEVVGVADGDTVTLLIQTAAGAGQVKARLMEIDAPERRQPWGSRARQALAGKAFGRQVQVAANEQDRYGRLLVRLFIGARDINREMVREGHAWVYRRYATEPWLPDEAEARGAKLGLWSLGVDKAVPPWSWRRGERERKPTATPSHQQAFSCSKRLCREMASCAEALFHLSQCAQKSLDRDQDGVPCESICRS